MIKGINHQIIEVNDTENIYYERAWLVVKPQYADVDKDTLTLEARRLTKKVGVPSSVCRNRHIFSKILMASLGALFGVILTLLIERLI